MYSVELWRVGYPSAYRLAVNVLENAAYTSMQGPMKGTNIKFDHGCSFFGDSAASAKRWSAMKYSRLHWSELLTPLLDYGGLLRVTVDYVGLRWS